MCKGKGTINAVLKIHTGTTIGYYTQDRRVGETDGHVAVPEMDYIDVSLVHRTDHPLLRIDTLRHRAKYSCHFNPDKTRHHEQSKSIASRTDVVFVGSGGRNGGGGGGGGGHKLTRRK